MINNCSGITTIIAKICINGSTDATKIYTISEPTFSPVLLRSFYDTV